MTSASHTAFNGHAHLATGSLAQVALAVKHTAEAGAVGPVLTYDDSTGRLVDIDTRGSDEDLVARLDRSTDVHVAAGRGRGRPKLGVTGREVTLLPRHWEWLNAQSGGASVALRKLVEAASRDGGERDRERERRRREAAYSFMSSMAGDFPNFEEAARSLFAGDEMRLRTLVADWPVDVREYVTRLAYQPESAGG